MTCKLPRPNPHPHPLSPALAHIHKCLPLSSTIFRCAYLIQHLPLPSATFLIVANQDSRVADVSRILDSSYLSSSTSSSPTSVYADTDGNLHDPDYRHFPAVAPPRRPARESGGNDNELDIEDFDERARHRSASPRERAAHATLPMRTSYPTPAVLSRRGHDISEGAWVIVVDQRARGSFGSPDSRSRVRRRRRK